MENFPLHTVSPELQDNTIIEFCTNSIQHSGTPKIQTPEKQCSTKFLMQTGATETARIKFVLEFQSHSLQITLGH